MICVGIARGRHRHMIAEHKFLADNGIGLVELRLWGNRLGPASGRYLALALRADPPLRHLDLANNRLGPSGAHARPHARPPAHAHHPASEGE